MASDTRQLGVPIEIGPNVTPCCVIADKGYDSKANREMARERGIIPVIPYRNNVKNQPKFFPKELYRARSAIEQCIGKLKRFKRVAMRCEKTKQNYASIVALACGFILIKSVHVA